MRHRTTVTAGVVAAALAVAALTGCSSSDDSDGATSTTPPAATSAGTGTTGGGSTPTGTSAAPTKAPGKVDGHLDYTGAVSGSADFTGGVSCEVKNGRLIGLTAPDVHSKTQVFPSFIATTADSPTQVALFNTPDKKSYLGRVSKSQGVTGNKSGSSWTVTVKGLQIAQEYGGSGPVITVSGSFDCTRVS